MLQKYQKELELRGITGLDELNDDGTFSKLLINDKDRQESGYVGVIQIDKNDNVEVIYVRHDANERRLICDNFRGTYIQSDLSLIENRDPITLFEDYSKDANLFIEIQRLNRYKYYMLYKATGVDQEERKDIVSVVDQEIQTLQQKLESARKM